MRLQRSGRRYTFPGLKAGVCYLPHTPLAPRVHGVFDRVSIQSFGSILRLRDEMRGWEEKSTREVSARDTSDDTVMSYAAAYLSNTVSVTRRFLFSSSEIYDGDKPVFFTRRNLRMTTRVAQFPQHPA